LNRQLKIGGALMANNDDSLDRIAKLGQLIAHVNSSYIPDKTKKDQIITLAADQILKDLGTLQQ
jgi:hypothetical protein